MREEKRELYREGTPDNLKKGYTDLVYGGSGVEVEKGVISASGSGGDSGGGEGGGGAVVLSINTDSLLTYNGNALTKDQFDELYANNAIIFYRLLDGDYSDFGYVASYDDSNSISIIETSYDMTNDDGGVWSKINFTYDSINDCWVFD